MTQVGNLSGVIGSGRRVLGDRKIRGTKMRNERCEIGVVSSVTLENFVFGLV